MHTQSSSHPADLSAAGAKASVSGAAMDRVVAPAKRPWYHWLGLLGACLAVVYGTWHYWQASGSRTLAMNGDKLKIAPVQRGEFEDYIAIRGRVTPRKTVYLDAIEGGQIKQRLVEDGAMVEAGELIVVLNNTALQLDVTRNEAMVTEQLNNMRTLELQLERNRLEHRRNLVEMDYEITRLQRQIARLAELDAAGVAIRSQLEDARDELAYFQARRTVTLESQATDARLQQTQLDFLNTSAAQLEDNLALSRLNLEALQVRAPVAGKLSGMDVEVGQSIARGGRLGQIDDPAHFKLRASVDEYYLNRVALEQQARYERDGHNYPLRISKIYPQVSNGQFEIDLLFTGEEPTAIRRGQTLQAKLTLGEASEALLIPNGAFYQDTGGRYLFVLDASGTQANKRTVSLGRRNARHIEVLAGLEAGERVVVSPYSNFKDMDRLALNP
jgi:HlyD family secretion protein